MPRIVRLLAALAVLCALTGAESCKEQPSQDQQGPGQQRVVLVTADGDNPYTVGVRRAGQLVPVTGPVPVASGEYRQSLWYTSGQKIKISVLVYSDRHTDVFSCSITDGEHVIQRGGAGAVNCALTTSR